MKSRSYWIFAALTWACGGSVGGGPTSNSTGGSNAGGAGGVTLPIDPTAGCRDYSTPECSQCCRLAVDHTGATSCTVEQFSSTSFIGGNCPSNCQPCAMCSAATENYLLGIAAKPHTDCDCPHVYIGIDPCFSDGCECFCSSLASALADCPELAPTVCRGNHCGVELWVKPGPYRAGDLVDVYWFNFSSVDAYVSDCGNPEVLQLRDMGTSFTVAPPKPCTTDTNEMLLAPRTQTSVTIVVPDGVGGGFFFVHGTYFLGCPAGISSPTACGASPIDVSSQFQVYSQ